MLGSVFQFVARCRLLLLLAAALGCLFFPFELFAALASPGGSGLLARKDSVDSTLEVVNGAYLTAILASLTCFALGACAIWFCWRRLKARTANHLTLVTFASLTAAACAGLGIYLGVFATTRRSLPAGDIPYSHHQMDLTGIEPLGLALLAGFILSVAVVGIVRPRFLVAPVVFWLVVAFMFGMFESAAIRRLELFERPTD